MRVEHKNFETFINWAAKWLISDFYQLTDNEDENISDKTDDKFDKSDNCILRFYNLMNLDILLPIIHLALLASLFQLPFDIGDISQKLQCLDFLSFDTHYHLHS